MARRLQLLAKLSSHIRTNFVAYIALFVAMGGTAMAAKPLITGEDIQDGSLTGADVSDSSTLKGVDIDESDLGKVGDADTLDGSNSTAFLGANAKAADSDKLDGSDSSAFLGANAKAADSDKLDGLDSTALKSDGCPAGYVWDGAICWENIDQSGLTLAGAANRCRAAGGRLPLLSEVEAMAKAGIVLGNGGVALDWTANAAGDDISIYINSVSDPENMDGVRPNSTASFGRCVHAPVNALGSP